ncbi:unnamed protein product [Dibothriocephalus latus]|uniref:Uncharacterized protein n=1 Tax=Dibothriocephalus latus TaxID=60516 RepID=A0A3P7LD96_DIBLA|nr:unnamed protein product [Dibothriocephalus latus]
MMSPNDDIPPTDIPAEMYPVPRSYGCCCRQLHCNPCYGYGAAVMPMSYMPVPISYMPMVCSPYTTVCNTPMPLPVDYASCRECDNMIAENEMQDMLRNEEVRRTTESIDRKSTWRTNTGTLNTVSDFEETQWMPLDESSVFQNHELMFRRDSSFQKSVELPNGIIVSLNVDKPQDTMLKNGQETQSPGQTLRLHIYGRVRQWRKLEKIPEEIPFEEVSPANLM